MCKCMYACVCEREKEGRKNKEKRSKKNKESKRVTEKEKKTRPVFFFVPFPLKKTCIVCEDVFVCVRVCAQCMDIHLCMHTCMQNSLTVPLIQP